MAASKKNRSDSDTFEGALRALEEPDAKVRRRAAEVLARHKDARAVPHLIAALADTSAPVRRWAAEALRGIEAAEAAPALIAALGDGDAGVREKAVRALLPLRTAAAVAPLIAALRDPAGEVQYAASGALAFMGRAVVPTLVECLETDTGRPLDILGQIKDPAATPALVRLLHHADARVRERAVRALAGATDSQAVAALKGLLEDPDSDLRGPAASALGRTETLLDLDGRGGAAWSGADIEAMLRDPAARVRAEGVAMVAKRELRQWLPAIVAALGDPSNDVRHEGVKAVEKLASVEDLEPVPALLGHPDAGVRQAAAEVLEHFADTRFSTVLLPALRDESPRVRVWAAMALGRCRETRAVASLLELARDEDSWAASAAIDALLAVGGDAAVDALMRLFREQNPDRHHRVAWALGQLDAPRARSMLVEAASRGDDAAAAAAYRHVVAAGDANALGALERALGACDAHAANAPGIVSCFYQSGHPRLRARAENWAKDHRRAAFLKRESSIRWGEPASAADDRKD